MKRSVEIIISIPLCLLVVPLVVSMTHWSMTKESLSVKKLKKASYSEIKEKMLGISWEYKPEFPHSLFDAHDWYANYFHASIFRFGDVGYLLTPYGVIMANILQRRIRRTLPTFCKKPYIN